MSFFSLKNYIKFKKDAEDAGIVFNKASPETKAEIAKTVDFVMKNIKMSENICDKCKPLMEHVWVGFKDLSNRYIELLKKVRESNAQR